MSDWIKTFMLMAAITALFIVIGGMIDGRSGTMLVLLFALGMNLFSYWLSDKMVLRMYNVQEVNETSASQFYWMMQEFASRVGPPVSRVYPIDEAQSNTFATGRDPEHVAVAATTGILNILSECELCGVMAYKLAHVQHRDILISTILATMAGAVSALADFAVFFGGRGSEGHPASPVVGIAVAILAPLTASLIQMAISRAREFEVGCGGAIISGDPQALASALDKIHRYVVGIPFVTAETHPATVQMIIMNPLHGGGLTNLFSTYLITEEHIVRLMQMAQTGQYPA